MKFKVFLTLGIISVFLCGCDKSTLLKEEEPNSTIPPGAIKVFYHDNYFIGENMELCYYDQEKQQECPLCFKENCKHNDYTCDSFFEGPLEGILEEDDYIYCMSVSGDTSQIERCNKDGSDHQIIFSMESTYGLNSEFEIESGYLFASYSYIEKNSVRNPIFNTGCIAINLETLEETTIYTYTGYQASVSPFYIDNGYIGLCVYGKTNPNDKYTIFSYKLKLVDCQTLEVSDITSDLWGYSNNVVCDFYKSDREFGLVVKKGKKYDIHIFDLINNEEVETIKDIQIPDNTGFRSAEYVQNKYIFSFDDQTAFYYDVTTNEYKKLKTNIGGNWYMDIEEKKEDGFVITFFNPDPEKWDTITKFVDFDTFFNVDYFGDSGENE